jgi:hypothetical protein
MARRPRREINVFSLSFLDLISGALGAVIILYVAVPKANPLQEKMSELAASLRAKETQVKELENEVTRLKEVEASAAALMVQNDELKKSIPAPVEPKSSTDFEVGFKFKGKKLLFIVDTSRSMLEEDRMGQVKAGLKMLLTSMPPSFEVDVVQYPNGERTPFKPLFGKMRPLNSGTRQDVFDFLYKMKPLGATPTRDVMNYAFRTYPQMTDIVLLTDGEPSIHNSVLKDDIHDLLGHIRTMNPGTKVQVNTIGVGEEVLHDKAGRPYQFLKLLAEQNDGFFVGF